ncbi:HAD family hydrolase [Frondihabitans cladoniiphilus]|uniref:Hydrolase of the HAD superfamily n=1 Tax=Frondihabitans cladoniiphilus TaxID=715785 RepID=A0ABP8W564_9MICO
MPRDEASPPTVLFDLFGTLIPSGDRTERDALSAEMAGVLGVDEEAFAAAFRGTFGQRTLGELGDVRSTIGTLTTRITGVAPADDVLDRATRLRLAFTERLIRASWALDALALLRDRGSRLGLVTDCSAEVPEVLPGTPLGDLFEAAAYSCALGTHKPSPVMYLHVTDSLDVDPADCVYVGDGGSHELSGARDVGMTAVLFERPGTPPVPQWDGLRVSSIADVAQIVPARA